MPALVDHFALTVHHIVVFQQPFSDAEVVFLYFFLSPFNAFGHHTVLDDLSLLQPHPVHQASNAFGSKKAHQVVFQ